jgi:uncharacterized membrane protein YbhN (UPF0104 family)
MPEPSEPRPAARRYALLAFKLTVSAGLLIVLFRGIDASRLWASAASASVPWLGAALFVYSVNAFVSTWRWGLLLEAQDVKVSGRSLLSSILVALFFNNFLPSNIGGDVVRIRDTSGPARSLTLAASVVVADRALGLIAVTLVAATGATLAQFARLPAPIGPPWLWGAFAIGASVIVPAVAAPQGVGRLLSPFTVLHPEWVGGRISVITAILGRFRERPLSLAGAFSGALFVQATMVFFYGAVARALHIPVPLRELAVIVPISFVVQLIPMSVNGFGVREATFSFYFAALGLTIESAVLMSLMGTALIMLFSLIGAGVYIGRTR